MPKVVSQMNWGLATDLKYMLLQSQLLVHCSVFVYLSTVWYQITFSVTWCDSPNPQIQSSFIGQAFRHGRTGCWPDGDPSMPCTKRNKAPKVGPDIPNASNGRSRASKVSFSRPSDRWRLIFKHLRHLVKTPGLPVWRLPLGQLPQRWCMTKNVPKEALAMAM